jgi:hypothetical protein
MTAVPTAPRPRHAFGWPAGSIRALLALAVLGLMWLMVLRPLPDGGEAPAATKLPTTFVYLQMLMVLILVHFFTAHGGSIRPGPGERSPLGLPRGSVRFLLLAGYLGLAYYLWTHQFDFNYPLQSKFLLEVALMLSAFFVGHIVTGLVRTAQGTVPPAFQDIEAWIALLSLIVMGILVVIQVMINPSLPFGQQIEPSTVEGILAALVGFYFGARS